MGIEPVVAEVTFEQISQTVLKLAQPLPSDPPNRAFSVSPEVLVALQKLVEIVAKLRSPTAGWPTTLAYTAENLITYVSEEADEVLALMQAEQALTLHPATTATFPQSYWSVANLIPRLLWDIARSSYDLMQLLGGIPARIQQSDGTWQPGILRLVVILAAQSPNFSWQLDLTTNQPAAATLPVMTSIQMDEGYLCRQPTETAVLLQQLTEQMAAVTPEVSYFTQPLPVELLQPGQDWCSGTLQLSLSFAFTETVSSMPILAAGTSDSGTLVPPLSTETLVRLADPIARQSYLQTVMQQQLEAIVLSPQSLKAGSTDVKPALDAELSQLIETANRIVDAVPDVLDSLGQESSQPAIFVDEWMPKLFWYLTRNSYDRIHLISGLKAKVLQPGTAWASGMLRLLLLLQVTSTEKTSTEKKWQFDLSTGAMLSAPLPLLSPAAVVHLNINALQPDLNQAGYILEQATTAIQTALPFAQALMQGITVELLDMGGADQDWQPATLQLTIALELR